MQCLAFAYPEVGENILSLNIFNSQADLPECMIFITLKVSKGHLNHTMLKPFWSNLMSRKQNIKIGQQKINIVYSWY